jgi:hypothetical protein
MGVKSEDRPLKVCATCRHWVYQYKGLCTRLNQGVGKFWMCEGWAAAEGNAKTGKPGVATPSPSSP